MLRFGLRLTLLTSSFPLLLAAVFARGELAAAARPCIMAMNVSVQLAAAPWQAQLNVAFTDNPERATVRVQIVDSAELADFAVIDDVDNANEPSCAATAMTQFIAITNLTRAPEPLIYLSQHGNADYRVFVRSKSVTPREAAALIVGAHLDFSAGHPRLAAL